jgi:probable F420-dependent oxidoreductase
VRLGLVVTLTDKSISAVQAAHEAEVRGFDSLWIGEHTHLPTGTVHQYTQGRFSGANRPEGYVPDVYKRFVDPYVSLAAAAAATSSLRIGTVVALPAEHNPLTLAKTIATLDMVSNGRFEWGIGFGWNPLETENNGVAFADRRKVLREKVLAIRALWTEEVAEFSGEYVRFSPSWSWPKPVQRPHPPILLGAKLTPANIRNIVEFADGCVPVRAMENEALAGDLARLRQAWADAGRAPSDLHVSLLEAEGTAGSKRSIDVFRDRLPQPKVVEGYLKLGIDRFLVGVPGTNLELYRAALDAILVAASRWPTRLADTSPTTESA